MKSFGLALTLVQAVAGANQPSGSLDLATVIATTERHLQCVEPFERRSAKIYAEIMDGDDRAQIFSRLQARQLELAKINQETRAACDETDTLKRLSTAIRTSQPEAEEWQITTAARNLLYEIKRLHEAVIRFDEGSFPLPPVAPPQAPAIPND